jgi:hypothetical protein
MTASGVRCKDEIELPGWRPLKFDRALDNALILLKYPDRVLPEENAIPGPRGEDGLPGPSRLPHQHRQGGKSSWTCITKLLEPKPGGNS